MNVLDEFVRTACQALGVDKSVVDQDLILELTKDVAHNVTRPAAPISAFIVGLAAGRAGGDADAVRAAVTKLAALAGGYTAPDGE